jgi:IS30 family transposase
VDRKSRLTKLSKIQRPTAELVHRATVQCLKKIPVRSLTNDNGCEFIQYQKTQSTLLVPIYFTRPYASWERGTVENTNKLIRQYFPKKTRLEDIPNEKIKMVETLLNHRPRKTLEFRTPLEVCNEDL